MMLIMSTMDKARAAVKKSRANLAVIDRRLMNRRAFPATTLMATATENQPSQDVRLDVLEKEVKDLKSELALFREAFTQAATSMQQPQEEGGHDSDR